MKKLNVVVGLPGSGKSHLVGELCKSCRGICVEDYMKSSLDNAPGLTNSRHYKDLVCCLREGKECVIADIEFCKNQKRDELKQLIECEVPMTTVKWHFFENDPKKCIKNVENRGRRNVEEEKKKVWDLSKEYDIPPDEKPISIWSGY